MNDYLNQKKGSHMWQHTNTNHKGKTPSNADFKVTIISLHKSSLVRQVKEAILIRKVEGRCMNNKEEYTRCYLHTWQLTGKPVKPKDNKYKGDECQEFKVEDKSHPKERKITEEIRQNDEPSPAQEENKSKKKRTSLHIHKFKFKSQPPKAPQFWTKWALRQERKPDTELGVIDTDDFGDAMTSLLIQNKCTCKQEPEELSEKLKHKRGRIQDMKEISDGADLFWANLFMRTINEKSCIENKLRTSTKRKAEENINCPEVGYCVLPLNWSGGRLG